MSVSNFLPRLKLFEVYHWNPAFAITDQRLEYGVARQTPSRAPKPVPHVWGLRAWVSELTIKRSTGLKTSGTGVHRPFVQSPQHNGLLNQPDRGGRRVNLVESQSRSTLCTCRLCETASMSAPMSTESSYQVYSFRSHDRMNGIVTYLR